VFPQFGSSINRLFLLVSSINKIFSTRLFGTLQVAILRQWKKTVRAIQVANSERCVCFVEAILVTDKSSVMPLLIWAMNWFALLSNFFIFTPPFLLIYRISCALDHILFLSHLGHWNFAAVDGDFTYSDQKGWHFAIWVFCLVLGLFFSLLKFG